VGIAIFLAFFGFYLLAGSRTRPWADATPMWQVAENLVTKHTIAISSQWIAPLGADGKIYCLYPLLTSLVQVPGAALRYIITTRFAPHTDELLFPLASHLAPGLLGALTCVLFYRTARRFAGVRAASLATLVMGLGTGVFYYARSAYSEALQTFCFAGFVLAIFNALDDPSAPAARRLGIWTGLLFNSKIVYLASVPGVAAVIAWRLRREPRRLLVFFAWAGAMLIPAFAVVLLYNWARWGSPLVNGYGPIGGGSFWRGFWGLLFSPGKSIFLYSPPVAVGVVGLYGLFRRHPAHGVALAAAILPVFVVYASYMWWDGDWGWGPRYLTFALPALCLPLAALIEAASARRRLAWLIGAAFAAGLAVQVIGSSLYWGHWFRIASAASVNWLGQPRCAPAPGAAGPCYPDDKPLYAVHWLPSLQPIAGHIWLLRHAPFGDTFEEAEKDAPWQVDGKIHIPSAAEWYRGTVIDWWALGWTAYLRAGAVVGAVMAGLLVWGAALWWRRARS